MGKIVDTMIVQAGIGVTPNSMTADKVYARLRELYTEGWSLFESHVLGSNPRETNYSFVLVKYEAETVTKAEAETVTKAKK